MIKLDKLLMHPNTKINILNFISSSNQTLLLVGDAGTGRKTLLSAIAYKLGSDRPEQQMIIGDNESTIGINLARNLRSSLKLRPQEDKTYSVIIPNAERLTLEAQNALLKLLEEPPKSTYFLLSTHNQNLLLPTVLSRAVVIRLQKPKQSEMIRGLTAKGYRQNDIENALQITDSSLGLTSRLLDKKADVYTESILNAKKILSMTVPERLQQIDLLTKDSAMLKDLLNSLSRVLHAGIEVALRNNTKLLPWEKRLRCVEESINALSSSVNQRVLLMRLMLQL